MFFIVYGILALVHGRPGAVVHAVVAFVVAVGLVAYYRSLRSKWHKIPPS